MKLKTLAGKIFPDSLLIRLGSNNNGRRFGFEGGLNVKQDIVAKYGFDGELLDLFVENRGPAVHKWHHYIPIYDRYFSRFRGKKVRFLELGVSDGGSLQMWRKYFGEDAVIFGVDIDPRCENVNGIAGQVRIGSQDDPAFLGTVIDEMGGVDVILDDGSHRMNHIRSSLEILFPKLVDGGIYMIEDLHTAYWRRFGGGYRSKANFFNFVSELVEDMHHWYHMHKIKHPDISNNCSSIHIHDSIVILEKAKVYAPTHSVIGIQG